MAPGSPVATLFGPRHNAPMRIYISADMEGATGVCHRDHLIPGGQDYEKARAWLTGDVNAAIAGARDAGATEFVVADGHATMRNLLLDELDDDACYLTGSAQVRNRPLAQLGALDFGAYDAAFLVGYHSRAGTPGGLLAHTWVGALVNEIRVNGKPASEATLNAGVLGHYGIPVVFACGASDFCQQAREDFDGELELVEVKQTMGPSAVLTHTPAKAQAMIRAGAKRSLPVRRAPVKYEGEVTMELDLHRDDMRERALEFGGEAVGRLGVRYVEEDIVAGAKTVWRALAHCLREDAAFLK